MWTCLTYGKGVSFHHSKRGNDNLELQAQALFRSWFVDFVPFGGVMPEDWREGKLSDIAEIIMGQSPEGSSLNQAGKGIIFYQGRTEFGNRFPSVKSYTTSPTRIARSNSVLLSVRAPVGDINITLKECCIGRGIAALNPKEQYNLSYLYLLLKSKHQEFDQYNGEGTVFGCINRNALMDTSIICPDADSTRKFGHIVQTIDNEIERRHRESLNLSFLRDTLLPKLMSGELKISQTNS